VARERDGRDVDGRSGEPEHNWRELYETLPIPICAVLFLVITPFSIAVRRPN
jgi:hypothetical protein